MADLQLNKILSSFSDMETVVRALRKVMGYSTGGLTLTEFFPKVLEVLGRGDIDFAVAGGFARSLYAPYRLTQDIDISVAANDLKKVENLLTENGFVKKDVLEYSKPSKRVIHKYLFEDKELDVILFETDLTHEILTTARSGNLLSHTVKVVSPEMLVIQKMLSYRNKDKADIIDIRDSTSLDMEIIRSWASKLKMFDRMVIFEEEKD
jgi:hypothetical protein